MYYLNLIAHLESNGYKYGAEGETRTLTP
ncbi:MAG: hypothetical protein ACI8QG_000675 [Flavobacteriales bacterium]